MFTSKSKRLGFLGTLLFHLVFVFICFYTTMGSNFVLPPEGVEVQYMPIEKINKTEETILISEDEVVNEELVDSEKLVEKLIQDKNDDTVLPTYEDTITDQDDNIEEEDQSKVDQITRIIQYLKTLPVKTISIDKAPDW